MRPSFKARLFVYTFLFALAFFLFLKTVGVLAHTNHGFDPNALTVRWLESKRMPDHPESPCCGVNDSYTVARYEQKPDGSWLAWIADGSAIKYPDGSERPFWDINVPVQIPADKANPLDDDLDNPTDQSWIWMRVTPDLPPYVYCFVRHPQGS